MTACWDGQVAFEAVEGFEAARAAPLGLAWGRAEAADFLCVGRAALRAGRRLGEVGRGDAVVLERRLALVGDPVGWSRAARASVSIATCGRPATFSALRMLRSMNVGRRTAGICWGDADAVAGLDVANDAEIDHGDHRYLGVHDGCQHRPDGGVIFPLDYGLAHGPNLRSLTGLRECLALSTKTGLDRVLVNEHKCKGPKAIPHYRCPGSHPKSFYKNTMPDLEPMR